MDTISYCKICILYEWQFGKTGIFFFTPKLCEWEKLEKAVGLCWKTNLKATSTASHLLSYQIEFIKLRAQFLEGFYCIVIVPNTQCMTPSPAIAQTLAQNSRDHLHKFGHVINQWKKKFVKIIQITIRSCNVRIFILKENNTTYVCYLRSLTIKTSYDPT